MIVRAGATGPSPRPSPPALFGWLSQSATEAPSGRGATQANQNEKTAFQPNHR